MRRETQLVLSEGRDGADTVVVRLAGDRLALTDGNALVLHDLLASAAERAGRRRLALDLSNVEFVSSAALGVLLWLRKKVLAAGGSLALRGLGEAVYEVFEATGLTALLDVRPAADRADPSPAVLIADDDDCVRVPLVEALRRHGFRVVPAATGPEAVARYREAAGAVAAVLLDVNMPGLSGPETLTALRALAPGVRCCFMTGDLGRYSEQALLALGAARVFYKPFGAAEVVEALRRLSDNPTARD